MRRFLFITFALALSFILLTIALVWAFGDKENLTLVAPLKEIDENKPLYLESEGVYFVRRGARVAAVDQLVVIKHEAMGVDVRKEEAIYCHTSGLFESPWGGKFDWRGRYYGGPAPRGLTTYPVTIEDGSVYVDFANPREGLPRSSPATEPVGPFCDPV